MTIAPEEKTAPAPVPTVTFTIDGIEVTVPKGELVIRAAERLGITIPRFCDHPLLDPAGACRQCMVEVEMGGRPMPKPQASCTLAAADGMVVKTQLTSPVAEKAQRGQLEFLLINHPLDCPICDKGGECPLQNQAMSHGNADSRFLEQKRTYPKPLAISSQVLLDRERCVLCQRCTRFSEQIAGDPFIDLLERGADQQIGIDEREPFQSYFSGNTVQICPVGALTGAAYRFRARPYDLVSTPSVCEHCSGGCSQRTDWRRNKVLRRLAGDDPEVNEEWNCDKGRWAFTYATAPDRLTTPLVRNADGELEKASWTEAFERAAAGLLAAHDAGSGVGVLPGGRLTLEDAYAYGKFARAILGTNDLDFRTSVGTPAAAIEEEAFLGAHVRGTSPGRNGVTFTDLENAPVVLLVGLDAEDEAASAFLRLRKGWRKHGLRLFSVGPYASRGLTKAGGKLVPTVPGREAEVLNALAANGGDQLRAKGAVPELAEAADAIRTDGAVILVGSRMGTATGTLSAVATLATAAGARFAWIPRRAGDRGAVEAGVLPTLLPGGAPVTDPGARADLERRWGLPVGSLPTSAGRNVNQIFASAASGELSALVVGGVDPADTSDPEATEAALTGAGFVVSLELRESAVTRRADVVFPVAAAAEKAGAFVNWEGRHRPFEATLPKAGTMPDREVLDALAEEMLSQASAEDSDSGDSVSGNSAAGNSVPPASLDTARLDDVRAELADLPEPLTWPTGPTVAPVGTAQPAAGEAVLATWSQLLDAGRMQDNEPHLAGTARTPVARISAGTAAEVEVADGQHLRISTDRGTISLPAAITEMPDRVVWVPANSPGSAVRRQLAADSGVLVKLSTGTRTSVGGGDGEASR